MNEIIAFLENKPCCCNAMQCDWIPYRFSLFCQDSLFHGNKNNKIESFSEPVPHSEEIFESDLVSATLVTKKIGAKYGCITSVADMIKVALPTLLIKLVFTSHPYYPYSLFGVIGHNFPVYYRFMGGRGESPILGIFLVINWFGIILVNVAATILGFITGSVIVVRWSGYVLMIFWLWIILMTALCIFMVLINFFFWFSMRKDLARFIELKKKKG